ncbi:hypothetical protein C8R44DRAFT_727238 [Mycena epipterygia]|nr:hypothetical protein C8R44DRAFT_727238 [Mycena epipterygia]
MKADRARIADVNAEIRDLKRSLVSLRKERRQIQDRLNSYKYPVLTLPNEITSEIFIHFLPGYPICPLDSGIFSPSLLTLICRKWREIALATPALWRAIGWTVGMTPHILESWLARSGISPLSIRYKMDGRFTRFKIGPSEFFQTILAYHTRWQNLELLLSKRTQPPTTFFQGTMPSLRHLKLKLDTNIDTPLKFPAFRVPLLRSVVLDDLALSTVDLPWAQLTSLTLHAVDPADYTLALQKAVNLVHCELLCSDGFTVPQHTGEIHLMYLESLVLERWYNAESRRCHLKSFVLPALRKLQVAEGFLGRHPIDALASFISRSGCEVHNACITGRRITSRGTYRHAFPGISRFIFNEESTRSYFGDGSDDEEDDEEEFTDSEDSDQDEEDWTTDSDSAP